jgi:quercetin dioxygenase-like cupin family protein
MTTETKPIRRVVTGTDETGKSKVMLDGAAPNNKMGALGTRTGNTNLWVWAGTPITLSGDSDDGDMAYDFPGPPGGGHVRVVETLRKPDDYDEATDANLKPVHEPTPRPGNRSWDRGGKNAFSSGMHKTQSVDIGIMLEGERELILDDRTLLMKPGDIAIQVGAWHNWSSPRLGAIMAFDMIDALFVDGETGVAQGSDKVVEPAADFALPEGVKPARRIVTIDREPGKSSLVADGPAPDVVIDPARPGFASARLWVIDSTPAKIVFETLHLPRTIEPPKRGAMCRVDTIPPDANWQGKVGAAEVEAYYSAAGSPAASTYSPDAPHPYTQKVAAIDFCFILEGEVVLVLDKEEVTLKAGDTVVQRGTNHAWSNRSTSPCVMAVTSHDGVY